MRLKRRKVFSQETFSQEAINKSCNIAIAQSMLNHSMCTSLYKCIEICTI